MRLALHPHLAPSNSRRREDLRTLCGFALLPLAALAACGTPAGGSASSPWPHSAPRSGTPAPPGSATTVPDDMSAKPTVPAAPVVPPVVTERRWFEEWFGNTPVLISQPNDNTLQLSVPMVHSFDPGRIVPRPALAAVLDRVAESLRRQASARLSVSAAPDARASASQGLNRAHRIVEYIVSRRVMPDRISTPTAGAQGQPVVIQLRFLPPPIM